MLIPYIHSFFLVHSISRLLCVRVNIPQCYRKKTQKAPSVEISCQQIGGSFPTSGRPLLRCCTGTSPQREINCRWLWLAARIYIFIWSTLEALEM